MIRVGSQLIYCSPEKILRRTVVERNEQNFLWDERKFKKLKNYLKRCGRYF